MKSRIKSCEDVLSILEERHGGVRLLTVQNKHRWRAPWSLRLGNTVYAARRSDGSCLVYASGKTSEAVREILGPESYIKQMGTHATQYAFWHIETDG